MLTASNGANNTVISLSSDDSLIYIGTSKNVQNYSADCSDTDSSWSFETPPDLDEKLKLLYSGKGSAFLHDEPVMTSTPKQKPKEDKQNRK